MHTLTFYSYKGGTGRTLLLANVASLAARLGRRVVVLDLDLEAPGLHYKYAGVPQPPDRGVLDWLGLWFSGEPEPIRDFAVEVPMGERFRDGGAVHLIPAGRAPSPKYFGALQRLKIDERVLEGNGVDAFLDLQIAIREEFDPDFLFIDSRTGITSTNAVTTRVMADSVTVLAVNSPEQLEGTRSVLRTLQPLTSHHTNEPIALHFVLSRLVSGGGGRTVAESEADQAALTAATRYLTEPTWPIGNTVRLDAKSAHVVHHDAGLASSEYLSLGQRQPKNPRVHDEYLGIANLLLPGLVGIRELEDILRGPGAADALAFFAGPLRAETAALSGRPERMIRLEEPTSDGTSATRASGHSLESTEEVVDLYRVLAATNPAVHTPKLAASLNNYAIQLAEVGRHDEALAPAGEAVDLYRALAATNPAVHTPKLAASLNNYAIQLAEVGSHDEALAPAGEAVDLYRALAATNPAAHTPDVAKSLSTYAIQLAEVGRHDEALAPAGEAVDLYRALAATNPAAHTPKLAASLNNYAIQLAEVGRHDEALSAAGEAVDLYRVLAEANPTAYTPELAASSRNSAVLLAAERDVERSYRAQRARRFRHRHTWLRPE